MIINPRHFKAWSSKYAWLLLCVFASVAQAAPTRYSHASQLNIRANPEANAAIVGRLAINQPVSLLKQRDARWCEIQIAGSATRGFVDCSFLQPKPLALEQIDTEISKTILDLNRLTLSLGSDSYYQAPPDNNPEALAHLDRLFTLLERHFAVSPSLFTYHDYNNLLRATRHSGSAKVSALAAARLGAVVTMHAAFTQDFSAQPMTTVRGSIGQRVNQILQQRRYGNVSQKARPEGPGREQGLIAGAPQPADKASFFSKEKWAAGWESGGRAQRLRTNDTEGVVYVLGFDGTGPWAMADLYEMAKAQRLPVKAKFGKIGPRGLDLTQAQATEGQGYETLVLELRLPVWAITAEGLVQGTLRKASFGGDSCSENREVATAVEVVFAKPLKGDLYGVFASNAPIDASRAVVRADKRTILAPLSSGGFETTFTHRMEATVDLDGDGIADLRSVISNDTSAKKDGNARPVAARDERARFIRVAGWYASNVYMLQANENGIWRTLSRYDLVTCT